MKILAIDTTASCASVALLENNAVLESVTDTEAHQDGHIRNITILLELVLQKRGIWYEDCQIIAVTSGPGRFTRIRIGMTAARAISVLCPVQLMGVASFDLYRAALQTSRPSTPVWLLIALSKRSVAVRQLSGEGNESRWQSVNTSDLDKILPKDATVMGDDYSSILSNPRLELPFSRAAYAGEVAYALHCSGTVSIPEPFYMM